MSSDTSDKRLSPLPRPLPRPSKRPRKSVSEDHHHLSTINRPALDFDPPPICSISLVSHQIYACLVCGRFFYGRAPATPAHTHALLESHHLFINLTSTRIHSLPDDNVVDHPTLHDIINAMHPRFQTSHLSELDTKFLQLQLSSRDLRIRGAVGLDSMHTSNAANVVLQLVLRPSIVRNALLLHDVPYVHPLNPDASIAIYESLAVVCRKIWASYAFRPHIAPHSFMQLLSREATKHPALFSKPDPVDILAWLFNAMSFRTKVGSEFTSIAKEARTFSKLMKTIFQGMMCHSSTIKPSDGSDGSKDIVPEKKKSSFWFLSLDLPPKPLFKHQSERDIVPQVSLEKLLAKFNGICKTHIVETGAFKSYEILRAPQCLFLVVKRFSKSKFGVEKNPCVVHLPTDLLDVSKHWKMVKGRYRLIGAVSHEGSLEKGRFKVAIFHEASNAWFDITDVSVERTVFHLVSLRDSYILLYELVDGACDLEN